MTDRSL